MKLFVTVKPRARVAKLEQLSPNIFAVAVTEPPEDGRANAAVIILLAEHFGVAKSQVRIVSGATSRKKLIEVMMD